MSKSDDVATVSQDDSPCDAEKLNKLIEMMYQDLLQQGGRFKIMELLRALEFKRKIAPPDDREGAFWNMIGELRASELNQPTKDNSVEQTSKKFYEEPLEESKVKTAPIENKRKRKIR